MNNAQQAPAAPVPSAPIGVAAEVIKPKDGWKDNSASIITAVLGHGKSETRGMHPADRVILCDRLAKQYASDAQYWRARNERDGIPDR